MARSMANRRLQSTPAALMRRVSRKVVVSPFDPDVGEPARELERDPEILRLADSMCEELWFGDADPGATMAEAARSLAAAAARAVGLKPFPATAARLMAVLGQDDYRVDEVQRMLESDPALAAKLLRVANSALFASSVPCTSIANAVVRLGGRQVQEILAVTVTMEMFRDASGLGRDVLEHCVGVAAIARVLAKYWQFGDVDELYLAALLHDVGKLLCIESGEIAYDGMQPVMLEQPDAVHLLERAAVGYDHAVLAALVVRIWKIPEPVPTVIALHHQPGVAYQRGGPAALMVALLRLADVFEYNIRVRSSELTDEFAESLENDSAMDFADISVEQVRNIWELAVDARTQAVALLPWW